MYPHSHVQSFQRPTLNIDLLVTSYIQLQIQSSNSINYNNKVTFIACLNDTTYLGDVGVVEQKQTPYGEQRNGLCGSKEELLKQEKEGVVGVDDNVKWVEQEWN
jgi:hypothetical protein